jgi:CIC family chloride channel protein
LPTPSPINSARHRFREQIEQIQSFSLVLLACGVGLVTGGGAILFVELISFVQWLAIGSTNPPLYVLQDLPWYRILLVPAVGGLLVALVTALSREPLGHGVPEVIVSVALGSGKIRSRVAPLTALLSALTLGTGGSVGREGPIVHIGAALGSTLGQILRVPPSHLPTLAGCGVAGGIAAVFNAPISGAFFALEVIIGNFAMPSFGPVMLASVFSTVVSRTYFGNHPAFTVPGYTYVSAWELPLYLILGVLCAGGGLAFMFVMERMEDAFAKLPVAKFFKPALGGLILGGLILLEPHVYGTGYETMDALLRGGISWPWLLLLLPIKMGATSLTLASGGAGGLFLPALYLGAVLGGLWGFIVGGVFPSITGPSGGYALVGMAAFLAGVVHCPITAFLLLFEVTGHYSIILPLMVSCPLSTLVAKMIREESIYSLVLARRGIDIRRREANLMQTFTVGHVMQREAPTLRETAPFAEVVQHFLDSEMPACFIVNDKNVLLGEISIHDVKAILQEDTLGPLVIAKDLTQRSLVTTTPEETLARCLEKFTLAEEEYLPVVSPTQELFGIISRRHVLDLYNREILRREYMGLSLRSEGLIGTVHEQVRLPHNYKVEVVQVPSSHIGKTLRDSQLRTRFNLTAVAIRQGSFNSPDDLPDPDHRLGAQDFLVLVGRATDLERFAAESSEQARGLEA